MEPFTTTTHGLLQGIAKSTTALDAFQHIFDVSLFTKIAEETNICAAQKQHSHPDPTWTPTTVAEIKAFIAIGIQ